MVSPAQLAGAKVKVLLSNGRIETSDLSEKISLLWGAHQRGKKIFLLRAESFGEYAEWIYASFATPLTVVPVSSSLPPAALQEFQAQLPPDQVIQKENLREMGGVPKNFQKSLGDLWVVIFTSGSSGFPKGVALSGAQLFASASAHQSRFPQHTWLLSIPPYHIGGFSVLSRAHFLDLPIILSTAKVEDILAKVRQGGVDGISLVPTQLNKLLTLVSPPSSLPLKAILLGGAHADEDLLQRAKPWPIYLTYGMTETASQFATGKTPFGPLEPLPGFRFRINSDGELFVHAPTLASGYFTGGNLQTLPNTDSFFPTGDLAESSPLPTNTNDELPNEALVILGRKSERIHTGGMKVFPQQIEKVLGNFQPHFRDYGICAVSDPIWGETICLAYVGDDKSIPPAQIEENVRAFLARHLDKKLLPKNILSLDKIPRSDNGKILRRELSLIVSTLLQKRSERI